MTPQIVRLNEAALYALGMDRVTVQALRNIIRVTGTESDGPTIPDIGGQTRELFLIVGTLGESVESLAATVDAVQSQPLAPEPDLSTYSAAFILPREEPPPPTDHLSLELRQTSEALAQLKEYVAAEVRQMAEMVAQYREHFTTEVRQIADQQITNANLIQELKQGTML